MKDKKELQGMDTLQFLTMERSVKNENLKSYKLLPKLCEMLAGLFIIRSLLGCCVTARAAHCTVGTLAAADDRLAFLFILYHIHHYGGDDEDKDGADYYRSDI